MGKPNPISSRSEVRCPSFLDTCLVQFTLPFFIVNWRQHAVVCVLAGWVIEHLDVIEYVLPCCIACDVRPPPDPFPFQELKKALGDGIIMTVSTSAHACVQIVFSEKRLPLFASELRSLIGVYHDFLLWLAPPNCAQQCLQGQTSRHARLHRPSIS